MATQLTSEDFKQSLNGHVALKGAEIHAKYGPELGWKELLRLLSDRAHVRYPCEIVFDAASLLPGEMAHPTAKGDHPKDGFNMFVHPRFMMSLRQVPAIVLYQLVAVNYGEFASPDDAETFGSAALGLAKDDYYRLLCELAGEEGRTSTPCQCGHE